MSWQVHLEIERSRPAAPARTDRFTIQLDPQRTVLDAIELVWAKHDPSLTFRHACHHASCGSCAVVANGVEVLPCVAELQQVTTNGGTLRIGPLKNFPVVSDLVVDMAPLFGRMTQVDMPIVGPTPPLAKQPAHEAGYQAFENCLECGMCLSACPVSATNPNYWGPAALAAAYRVYEHGDPATRNAILNMVDHEDGVWRCHVAYECSAICPSNVDPAGKIMALRQAITVRHIKQVFGLKVGAES